MSEVQQVIYKVIVVTDDTSELMAALNSDWRISSGWNHPKGCCFVLEMVVDPKVAEAFLKGKKNG